MTDASRRVVCVVDGVLQRGVASGVRFAASAWQRSAGARARFATSAGGGASAGASADATAVLQQKLRKRAIVIGASTGLLTIGPVVWFLDDVLQSAPPPTVAVDVRGKWSNEDATVTLEFNRFHVSVPCAVAVYRWGVGALLPGSP